VHDVPEGSPVVFSAHGVAPAVRSAADERGLTTIDATCPLVTKVHTQARRYAQRGYSIVLIGHAKHEEVEGTTGEAPESIVLVQSADEAERVALSGDRIAYITQTTLSVDETHEIIEVLRRRFPHIEGPAREDICYATSNRQWAVKELLDEVDLLLVVGSRNSSNSLRLVEVAHAAGDSAHLVDDASEIDESWLSGGVAVVGVTSGASAPERLVLGVCNWFRARGVLEIDEFRSAYEDVVFRLPVELRRAERSAA
jgi:4-hydroxy-3-methylbut-2-enyl diphosphate reductase